MKSMIFRCTVSLLFFSIQSVNAAAARLLKREGAEAQGGTQAQLVVLNDKWRLINECLAGISHKLDGVGDSVHVDLSWWLWLCTFLDELMLPTLVNLSGLFTVFCFALHFRCRWAVDS